jgi:hypothetical protein
MARQRLAEDWGSEVQIISDDRIVLAFLDARRRRPAARPRRVWIADDFQCPPAHDSGWEALQKEIVQGIGLGSRMSRGHSSIHVRDGLLNEWGVHHFHLGTAFDSSGLVERTGPVVFARVTDNDFYAIGVYEHDMWEHSSILESLHRNWPDTIRHYRLNGIQNEPLTEEQRKNMRKRNVQTATSVADGTVYMSIDGGVASSGTSIEALRCSDMLESDVEQLQIAVQEQLAKFIPHLQRGGYAGQPEIKATLTDITPQGFQVDFLDCGVRFNVTIEGGLVMRNAFGCPAEQ